MRKSPESRGRFAVALLAAVVATACGNTTTEVESGVVAAGLVPALKLSHALPTQAELVPGTPADSASAHGLVQSVHSAVAEAEALSATLPGRLSAAVREAAVELDRPPLVEIDGVARRSVDHATRPGQDRIARRHACREKAARAERLTAVEAVATLGANVEEPRPSHRGVRLEP